MYSALTKKFKFIVLSLLLVLSFLIVTQAGLASPTTDGLNKTAEEGFGLKKTDLENKAKSDLPTIIGNIIGTALAFLGVVFFVLILYAGLTWILSMGKEEKINQSKEMITAAVLGLIVVLGAYAITNLIATIFTEAVPK